MRGGVRLRPPRARLPRPSSPPFRLSFRAAPAAVARAGIARSLQPRSARRRRWDAPSTDEERAGRGRVEGSEPRICVERMRSDQCEHACVCAWLARCRWAGLLCVACGFAAARFAALSCSIHKASHTGYASNRCVCLLRMRVCVCCALLCVLALSPFFAFLQERRRHCCARRARRPPHTAAATTPSPPQHPHAHQLHSRPTHGAAATDTHDTTHDSTDGALHKPRPRHVAPTAADAPPPHDSTAQHDRLILASPRAHPPPLVPVVPRRAAPVSPPPLFRPALPLPLPPPSSCPPHHSSKPPQPPRNTTTQQRTTRATNRRKQVRHTHTAARTRRRPRRCGHFSALVDCIHSCSLRAPAACLRSPRPRQ